MHLVEAGVDLNTIRDRLGHAHMSGTEIYARAGPATKRRALARLRDLDKKLFGGVEGLPGQRSSVRSPLSAAAGRSFLVVRRGLGGKSTLA